MSILFRRLVFGALSLLALCLLALVVQYQVRLRMAVGDDLIVGMSKGTWVDCVYRQSAIHGRIDRVSFTGVWVTDTTGSFTEDNTLQGLKDGDLICPGFELRLVDAKQRKYFVPFSDLGGLHASGEWFWTNPFPGSHWYRWQKL